ncbi:DUF1080 domain-containing protein [Leptobacterium flavescens]|uniref:DUF1080 domain-containing protein n=1 Tax=Leptobacterium flavescens TaxID=472055 RepID=A0A6P0UR90_9FLAO|nr:DUF1080 domain-containing protein [Leptobacterium flavescens]NER15417.1 DUF1080 domain-containing protein [Leptobacterium flavescens]
MKTNFLFFLALLILASCKSPTPEKNETEEWVSLFNGKDLKNWHIKIAGYEPDDNYGSTFTVSDSMIRVNYGKYDTFNNAFGHLFFKEPFSYYKLKFDYRFHGDQLDGGPSWAIRNSGVMIHSQSAESMKKEQHFPVSIEFQTLGGLGDGNRPTANVCTPGTLIEHEGDLIKDHCLNSNAPTYEGDEWVHVEVIVLGDEKIIHIAEKDTVLIYRKPQIGSGSEKREDRLAHWKEFGVRDAEKWADREGEALKEGYIAFQAESHPVDFKNIELLDLCGCKDSKAKNYKSYYVKEDNSKCVY